MPRASASTGPATTPAPRSSASRPSTAIACIGSRPAAVRARSTPSTGRSAGPQRSGRDRRTDPDAHLADVDQPLPGMHRPGHPAGLLALERQRIGQQPHQGRVGGVVAEQVRGDPVRNPQRPGEERPVGVLDGDQLPVDQRRTGQQPGPGDRRRGETSASDSARPMVARRRVTSSLR